MNAISNRAAEKIDVADMRRCIEMSKQYFQKIFLSPNVPAIFPDAVSSEMKMNPNDHVSFLMLDSLLSNFKKLLETFEKITESESFKTVDTIPKDGSEFIAVIHSGKSAFMHKESKNDSLGIGSYLSYHDGFSIDGYGQGWNIKGWTYPPEMPLGLPMSDPEKKCITYSRM